MYHQLPEGGAFFTVTRKGTLSLELLRPGSLLCCRWRTDGSGARRAHARARHATSALRPKNILRMIFLFELGRYEPIMNITTNAETGATTGRSRLRWRDQGTHTVLGHIYVQEVAQTAEARPEKGTAIYEGDVVNAPSGAVTSPDALNMAGEPPTEHKQAAPPDEENEG